MDRLIVIYDTSFLMRQEEPVQFERGSKGLRGGVEAALPPVAHIIPRQVKEEIHARLEGEEAEAAQRARTLCSKIMALPGCDEADLGRVVLPDIRERFLGPQTERDQRLVGLALDFLREQPRAAVYVATLDGGILAELSHRRAKEGLNVFTASTRGQLDALLAATADERREQAAQERHERSSGRATATNRRRFVFAAVGAVAGAAAGYWLVRQKRGDSSFTLLAGGLGGAVIGGWFASQAAGN
jgi:hypothetical protein